MPKFCKPLLLLVLTILSSSSIYAQLGVGTVSPVASAMMEVVSTEKGVLLARMNSTQRDAIASPATSLLIFNTSSGQFEYYDGSAWQPIDSGGDDLGDHTAGQNLELGSYYLSNDGSNAGLSLDASGNASFSSNASVTSNITVGNVLTVTDSASAAFLKLTNGAANGYVLQSDANGNAAWVDAASLSVTGDDLGDHTATTVVNLDGNWLSGDGDSEGVFVKTTGDVGVGTNDPQAKLHVAGLIVSTSAGAPSDVRFKETISPLYNATDILLQLKPVNYAYRTDEFPLEGFPSTPQIGFLAQDLETVLPHLVHDRADGYKIVDYAKMTPVLAEGFQELHQRVSLLEAENVRLKKALRAQDHLQDQLEEALHRLDKLENKQK